MVQLPPSRVPCATALHAAAEGGSPACIELVRSKAPRLVSARDGEGSLPLHAACGAGHAEAARELLEARISLGGSWLSAAMECDKERANAAHYAAGAGAPPTNPPTSNVITALGCSP